MRAFGETFALKGPILEIGAYQVAGQESLDLRGLFPGRDYIGLDMRPGPGVDCVASAEKLPQADASIGTVIACNTFEHVRCFCAVSRKSTGCCGRTACSWCPVPFISVSTSFRKTIRFHARRIRGPA